VYFFASNEIMIYQQNLARVLRFFVLINSCILTVKSSFLNEEEPISNTNAITSEKYSVFIGASSNNPSDHQLFDLHGLKKINNSFYVHARNQIFMVDVPKSIVSKESKKYFYEIQVRKIIISVLNH